MSLCSLAVRTGITTTAAACLEIIAASSKRAEILEIGLTLNAATASVFGLGRPAAAGAGPTSPVAVLGEDPTITGATTLAMAWTTPPTAPTNFLRRASLAASIGAGVIFTFPRGLIISASSSLVLWNLSAVSVADVWVVLNE
jgi:hypothetical protein